MLIEKEKIQEAKEKLGDRNFEIMMDCYGVWDYDTKNLKCSCPFHFPDKTPSFVYNKAKYYCHCFSCGKTVDVIDAFIATGCTYLEACQKLFELAGMQIPMGEMHVKTKADYRYPYEPPKNDRAVVNKYFALRGISEQTLNYCDVREEGGNVAFLYYDTNDVLTLVKYKLPHKPDKSKHEIKSWCQKDASTTPLLFNMNRVNTSMPLLITEGEPDCLAAIECGYTNSVSVPFGAGSNNTWIRENFEWLDQFPSIIIAFDNDEAGIAGTKDALYRLGSWKTKVMQIPETFQKPDGKIVRVKDINEMYFYMGKEAVLDAIINAKDTPVPSVEQFSDIEELSLADMDGIETGIDQLDRELLKLFYGTLTIITGRPGCVDCDTEFFNGEEWKRIADYREGDKVLQYNKDGTATLVYPEQYHKYECDSFWRLRSSHGIDQMVSDEHNIVYLSSKGNVVKKNVVDFVKKHNSTKFGSEAGFITTFRYNGSGINLTDAEIRVMCMVIADGSFYLDYNGNCGLRCRMNIKKNRKKLRARKLLEAAHIPYRIKQYNPHDLKYETFLFDAPIRAKAFPKEWYDCSARQLRIISEECMFWDGHIGKGSSYSTTDKQTADFLQFAFSASGYRSRVSMYDRSSDKKRHRGVEYCISKTKKIHPALRNNSGKKIELYKVHCGDGYKYCFTVPSGMLVLRRNGNINITGNSGKSSLVNQILANTIESDHAAFLFSQEMNNQMLSNWANLTISGNRHIQERTTHDGKTYYIVPRHIKDKIKRWTKDKLYIYKDDQPNDIKSVMTSMEACVRKYNTKLIILDNLMMLDLECSEDNKNTAQTKLINDLIQFAKKFNVAVILIAHPRKTQEISTDIGMYDIAGSSTIINLAMRSIGLRRVSKREKQDEKNEFRNYDVILTIIKDRMMGRSDIQIGLHYDIKSRRFFTNYEEYARDYSWDDTPHTSELPMPECLIEPASEVFGTIPGGVM